MRRQDGLPLGVVFGGLLLSFLAMLRGLGTVVAAGCVTAGMGAGLVLLQAYREGILRTPAGLLRRAGQEVRFRLQLGWWSLLILVWMAGGVFLGVGMKAHP